MTGVSLQALPPYAQELREKEAIEKDPELQKYLENLDARIAKISKMAMPDGGTHYTVETNTSIKLDVSIVYLPREDRKYGPVNFKVEFTPPSVAQAPEAK